MCDRLALAGGGEGRGPCEGGHNRLEQDEFDLNRGFPDAGVI